jgi:hypothetical protein
MKKKFLGKDNSYKKKDGKERVSLNDEVPLFELK